MKSAWTSWFGLGKQMESSKKAEYSTRMMFAVLILLKFARVMFLYKEYVGLGNLFANIGNHYFFAIPLDFASGTEITCCYLQ